MSDSSALESFLDKWRQRWPEWQVAEIFVAPERRALAEAWFSLLQEFDDILNIAGDPLPADAKLAWWGEELRSWADRRSRHPLGRRLEPVPAPWAELADALPALIAARDAAADGDDAFAQLRVYGAAVAAVEAAVLGGTPDVAAVIARTLATRLADTATAALPRSAAGNDDRTRLRDWARTLDRRWPAASGASRERRIADAFAHARLRRFARAGEATALPSRLRLLLGAWNAARG
ncbi:MULTISPECIES: phytoene/squalene synthase family protein [Pseudoxanthomonas]|uniref:phytoene/squalene synthase family protein n=1 Tax=Pseudoxanthomonas TaxID=83618 RepID=UPI00177BAD64|nr:phytoene/squalene synthase family protein [Pseudoxanthomonas beigongshangi]MBD9378430.1 phytoene/squalene synthase family protein [Pseudoxanthomonas sp. PXM04]UBB27322.1 phytoene/squalene synthase family protein [Pseudoxanthomonas japonensis]